MTNNLVQVQLNRSKAQPTNDQAFWALIRDRTNAISSENHADFIDAVLCRKEAHHAPDLLQQLEALAPQIHGVAAYDLLKIATQAFLLRECGVFLKDFKFPDSENKTIPDESARFGEPVSSTDLQDRLRDYLKGHHATIPYLDNIMHTAFRGDHKVDYPFCFGVLRSRLAAPCMLELIWSYWHEEGMLVQSMNAITRRFQNIRSVGDRDPLAHLEIAPLRPINNLLWGYIQDEQNRLTLKRRVFEYDHHYGITLQGKAVPTMRTADSRSKFVEGFHNLLHLCSLFYKDDNDTTVIADGFPLLNGLKEVHLLLAQGAHNQYGDLPWTARAEMLIQQYLIARPELRDFLQSRPMVPYKQRWMSQIDTMKTLNAWSDTTVTHFSDLGVFGEQLLLSVRYGDWVRVDDEDQAKNWARYWRSEVQGYMHAYRAVTGVDLSSKGTIDSTMPSVLLQKRLASQRVR